MSGPQAEWVDASADGAVAITWDDANTGEQLTFLSIDAWVVERMPLDDDWRPRP